MIRLKGTEHEAHKHLSAIPHAVCQDGLTRHWQVGPVAEVRAQSALWLFCWAKTGMGSSQAAEAARLAFNAILDVPYEEFEARVPHEWARQMRYSTTDIESELNDLLGTPARVSRSGRPENDQS